MDFNVPSVKNKRRTIISLIFYVTSQVRSCVKVEVVVLGSPSLMVLMVTVDVKQH